MNALVELLKALNQSPTDMVTREQMMRALDVYDAATQQKVVQLGQARECHIQQTIELAYASGVLALLVAVVVSGESGLWIWQNRKHGAADSQAQATDRGSRSDQK